MDVSAKSSGAPTLLDTPSTSESEIQHEPITFEDIFRYYDFEPSIITGDPDVEKIIREHKARQIQRTIDQLNRSMDQMIQIFPDFDSLEYYIAFDKGQCDTENILLKSTDKKFIKEVQDAANDKKLLLDPRTRRRKQRQLELERERELSQEGNDESSDDDDDDDDEDEEENDEDDEENGDSNKLVKHRTHRRKDSSQKINLPLPKGVNPKIWCKWSTIHQASYLAGIKNPNTYFYRNVAPGEKQRNGPWTKEEEELFFQRLNEMNLVGKSRPNWGIFSQTIPGRVGYQCANYYRKLVFKKKINDPTYFMDKDGVLRHKKMSINNRCTKKASDDDEPKLSFYERKALKNPFKHAIDQITKEEIKVPALSPDGYVLDYNTWLKLIKDNQAENPFTTAHIKKRQLVILTKKNIDQYRDQIKHILMEP